MRRKAGYTAAELALVIGVFTVLIAITAPLYRSFMIRNDLEVTWAAFNQALYRAQALARSGEGDSAWGVYIGNGNIVVYRGNSYASRNTQFDEIQSYPTTLSVGGNNEYNYQKITGLPIATGTTSLDYGGNTHASTVNAKGMVEQQ